MNTQFDNVTTSCPRCGGCCGIFVPSPRQYGLIINLNELDAVARILSPSEVRVLREAVSASENDFECAWCKNRFRLEIPFEERLALTRALIESLQLRETNAPAVAV